MLSQCISQGWSIVYFQKIRLSSIGPPLTCHRIFSCAFHSVIDFIIIIFLLKPYFDFLRTSAKPLQLHCLHRSASQVFLMWPVLSDDTHANQCGAPAFSGFFFLLWSTVGTLMTLFFIPSGGICRATVVNTLSQWNKRIFAFKILVYVGFMFQFEKKKKHFLQMHLYTSLHWKRKPEKKTGDWAGKKTLLRLARHKFGRADIIKK